MFTDLVLVALLGGLVVVDTTAVGQVMLSQPLVGCTLLGWLLGAPEAGVIVGLSNQLLWLRLVPLGGSVHFQGNFAGIVAAGVACLCIRWGVPGWYGTILIALGYGMIWGHLAGYLVPLHRNWNGWLIASAGPLPEPRMLEVRQVGAAVVTFLGGAVLTLVLVAPMAVLMRTWLVTPHPALESAGALAVPAFLGVGCVTAMTMFRQRGQWSWLILGVGGTAFVAWIL